MEIAVVLTLVLTMIVKVKSIELKWNMCSLDRNGCLKAKTTRTSAGSRLYERAGVGSKRAIS